MTASSMPGLRSDAARNHQRIVIAAAAAFEEDGPAVSLDNIARRAGVGIATLYRRFGTREELIKAVAEHVFAAEIASAIVEDGADPWEDLVATLTATIDAFAAHPVLTSLAKEHAVMGMDTMAAYAAAKERVLGRARDAGMVRQDLTAEAASHAVGYTSPSQFSREFKRLFGLTPAAETKRMRESFAIPAAFGDATYVSSH